MNDSEVPPPEGEEVRDEPINDQTESDERDQMVTAAVQQARQYHDVMDSAKAWARNTAADLRVEAALEDDEETADEIEEVAAIVKTVTERIEQGDNNRSRQPGRA